MRLGWMDGVCDVFLEPVKLGASDIAMIGMMLGLFDGNALDMKSGLLLGDFDGNEVLSLDGALLLLIVGLCDGLFDNAFLGDSVGDWLVGTFCGCLVGLREGGNDAVTGAFVNGKLVDGSKVVGSEVEIVGRCVGAACGCFGCDVLGFCIGVVNGLEVGSTVPVNVGASVIGYPTTGDIICGFSVGNSVEGA